MTRLLAALAAIALLMAGVVTGGKADASRAADPLAGAPAVGDCYDLTIEQAWKPATRESPVDCSARHTLLVGAVGVVPASVDWDDYGQLSKASNRICGRFWRSYYDWRKPSSYLTLLQGIWLRPTKAQRATGARWISCEIGLRAGDALLPLAEDGPARATRTPEDSIAHCATARYSTVACTSKHAYRATYAFPAKATGDEEAVQAKLGRKAQKACGRRVESRGWLWNYRSIGKRKYAVVCMTKTRR